MKTRSRSSAWLTGLLVVSIVFGVSVTATFAADKGCGSSGKTPDPKPDPSQKKQPKFVCEKKLIVHDPIWTGTKAEYTFKFKNDGDADLHIKAKGG